MAWRIILNNRRKVGTAYEKEAVLFLQKKGYDILEQNYYCKYGEIDIVAKESGYLVFVEVKYRRSSGMGRPESAVNYKKRKHIIESARYYMYDKYKRDDIPSRFDVVAIQGELIHLIKNAFYA